MPINLSPRAKKLLRWIGYPVLAIVSFLFALQQTFPYDRLKRKITDALAAKYDVKMKVSRGIMPGSVTFEKVSLTSRPQKPDDKITTIFIDKISAHLGLLSLLGGKASIDYDVKLGGGDISGDLGMSSSRTTVDLEIDKMSAEAVPAIAEFVGLPMGGRIEGTAKIDLPAGDWRQAEATIVLGCNSSCSIGDGVAKIYPKPRPGQPQLDGVTVAKLLLGQWHAEFVVTKGHADLRKFDVKSDDGELYVDFHVQIQRSLMDSPITQGCIKFKGSENLRKREEKFYNALNLTGAPLGPDGYHYIKLAGTLGNMRRLPQLCDLNGGGASPDETSGVQANGHIPRPPAIRTDNVDTAPPRAVPTYQPPTPGPAAAPMPPPAPAPTGDAPTPPGGVEAPPPQPLPTNAGMIPERIHPAEPVEGQPAGGGSAAGTGPGNPAGSGSVGIDQQMGSGTATGSGSGTGINVP
ncbi:MAG TPA: type II secretion system protein GspN [Kofleriaceae bacterium]|nr:type II secretion system protein GspN [Kofleriaceae bacterium]